MYVSTSLYRCFNLRFLYAFTTTMRIRAVNAQNKLCN